MRVNRLAVRNFTVFGEADFKFSPGLNVLIGANGTGKSHVLKVLYSILRPMASVRSNGNGDKNICNKRLGQPTFGQDMEPVDNRMFALDQPDSTRGDRAELRAESDFGIVTIAFTICRRTTDFERFTPPSDTGGFRAGERSAFDVSGICGGLRKAGVVV